MFQHCATFFGHLHTTRAPEWFQGNFDIFSSHTDLHKSESRTNKNKTANTLNYSFALFSSGLNRPCDKPVPFNSL